VILLLSNLHITGVGNLQNVCVAVMTILCGPSHVLAISQCKKGKNVLLLRRTWIISIYALPKHKGKKSQIKSVLMKQKFN
jgi:hypothetical protein